MVGYNTEVNTLSQIHNHVGYLCTPFTMAEYNTEVNTLQQILNHVGYCTTFTTDNLFWLRCSKTWLLIDNQ